MGVALDHRVGNQPLGQLAPQVGPAVGMTHPRAGMHFIDIQRRVLPVPAGPLLQPLRIAPAVLRRRDHIGRRPRAQFETAGVGIALGQHRAAVAVGDLETIEAARAGFGYQRLPHAAAPQTVHDVHTALPAVEIADHRDLRGIRCPDPECRPVGLHVRTEKAVGLHVPAFVEQVQGVG
ncbi:hypothetical protein D3C86_1606090 [compost metagenome]